MNKKQKSSKSVNTKKSDASKKGWITRRKNQGKQSPQNSPKRLSRSISLEKLKKLQKTERTRNLSRLKAQKKGQSLVSDKPKLNSKKPLKSTHRPSKRRSSIR